MDRIDPQPLLMTEAYCEDPDMRSLGLRLKGRAAEERSDRSTVGSWG
jgi:hypothetical protein